MLMYDFVAIFSRICLSIIGYDQKRYVHFQLKKLLIRLSVFNLLQHNMQLLSWNLIFLPAPDHRQFYCKRRPNDRIRKRSVMFEKAFTFGPALHKLPLQRHRVSVDTLYFNVEQLSESIVLFVQDR